MCNAIARKVSDNDRPSADDCIVSDPNASLDDTTIANIYILTNEDLLRDLCTVTTLESFDIGWSFHGRDNHTITNFSVHPNGNPGGVVELAVRPNHDVLSNGEIIAVVAEERCCNMYITAKVTNNGTLCGMRRYPPSSDDSFKATSTLILRNAHRGICCTVELVYSTSAMCALVD